MGPQIIKRLLTDSVSKILFSFLPIAGIETHFRSAENKSGAHGMPGIDFIYVINLDERPEKYVRTMEALKPYGITPYRFSAVNGWKLSFKAIDELGVNFKKGSSPGPLCSVYRHADGEEYMSFEIMHEEGVSYYSHCMSRGAIGCIMSHLSVLQDAYDSDYQTIWVMEDDIAVASDPRELSSLLSTLDSHAHDWDVLFTDPEIRGADGNRVYCGGIRPRPNFSSLPLSHYYERQYVSADLVKLGLRFGSHSMILRRSGMKKLLDFFKTYKIFFPYDMDYFFPPGIQLYATTRDIVTVIGGGTSDNGTPTYIPNVTQKLTDGGNERAENRSEQRGAVLPPDTAPSSVPIDFRPLSIPPIGQLLSHVRYSESSK